MEIKIPKEVRKYTESIFMGLNLKQCIMSGIAIALAVPIFLWLRPSIGLEGASWVCVVIVAPVGATAFIKIKNLPLLEYVIAFVKWFLTKNPLVSQPKNMYMDAVTQVRLDKAQMKLNKAQMRFDKARITKKHMRFEEVPDESDEADC